MTTPLVQIPGLILPAIYINQTDTELIADLAEHTSREVACDFLHEKMIHIMAVEVVVAGMPGNLLCWVELSPYPSTVSANYWGAIGGGGGFLPATAPILEVATGVNNVVHNILLPFAIFSMYCRVVVQTPVAAALPLAFWAVQAWIEGQGP